MDILNVFEKVCNFQLTDYQKEFVREAYDAAKNNKPIYWIAPGRMSNSSYLLLRAVAIVIASQEKGLLNKDFINNYSIEKTFPEPFPYIKKEDNDIMNFGQALEKVKAGEKIFRHGWNGKEMFVVYQKGYPDGIPCNIQTAKAWGLNEGDLFRCEPYLQIKMTNGSHAMWVPSINDILAEDWDYIH